MARRDETPRDLLFGLLALQDGLIDQEQLLAAIAAWSKDRDGALADTLIEQGAIDAGQLTLLTGMAEAKLKSHDGDSEPSQATVALDPFSTSPGECDLAATVAQASSHATGQDASATMSVGTSTGDGQRFRVLRPHAQGGLGAVFVALDGELNREVALKQILDHHADDEVSRTRFLIEAEVTGGLEHPGVVPVYGLGHYGDGRPYYAMRFIRGDSLKETIAAFHADDSLRKDPGRRSLELRKLLRRFVDVCNAIDYAHGRGVLHRDLKPGNVIVGKHGETLVVDWGLAKVMGRAEAGPDGDERTLLTSSTSGTVETLSGSALGTPSFMSPEQARGDLENLGPRSDVYSLGATLYCLLTGRPPFEGTKLKALLQDVQKGAFPPPRRLDPSIDRALEAICLKAMATRPEDRHATARALADDVERWAADEPTSAWVEPFSVRARRWMRRNRTAVTAAAVALVALLFGTGAVLAVQTRANADLKKSNDALAAAKDREAARFTLALEAINLFQGEVGDDLVLKADHFKPLRDRLLKGAVGFYDKLEGLLKDQPDRSSRRALGNARFELGRLMERIGDLSAALAAHRGGLQVRRELAGGGSIEDQSDLAMSLREVGWLLYSTGKSADALAACEEARSLVEGLPLSGEGSEARRFLLGRIYNVIGIAEVKSGRTARARSAYDQSIAILTRLSEDYPASTEYRLRLSMTHNNLASLLKDNGEPAEALKSYRQALAIVQKLVDDNPNSTEFRTSLSLDLSNVGILQRETGAPGEALESQQRAVDIMQKLVDDNPAVTLFRDTLADAVYSQSRTQDALGTPREALNSVKRSMELRQKLVDDNPAVPKFRSRLADSRTAIAIAYAESGMMAEALESFQGAGTLRQKLVEDDPSNVDFQKSLAESHSNLAECLASMGKAEDASKSYRVARDLLEKLAESHPTNVEYKSILAYINNGLADVQRTLGQSDQAQESYARAISILEGMVKASPTVTFNRRALASSSRRLGLLQLAAGDVPKAVASTQRSLGLYEGLKSRSGEVRFELACCHATLCAAAGRDRSGVPASEAEAEAEKAMGLLREAVGKGYRGVDLIKREQALDPLRSRPDFKLLMDDLTSPARPPAK